MSRDYVDGICQKLKEVKRENLLRDNGYDLCYRKLLGEIKEAVLNTPDRNGKIDENREYAFNTAIRDFHLNNKCNT